MEKINVQLASKTIEFSEYKNYYQVVNRVCYYNYPNGNGVILPYDDASLTKAQTLIDMPVQAKYTVNQDGLPDLLDHCVSIDSDGNYVFNTVSVGVHTSVEIKEDTVETFDGKTMTLPCLFATAKIWRRYSNYCAAIKRLYDEGHLNNSWELSSFSYNYQDGLKTLGDYVFDGNCYLGEKVKAAYGETSKILELSKQNKQKELLVASALSADLLATNSDKHVARKEDEILNENKENISNLETETVETSAEVVTEEIKEEPVVEVENANVEEVVEQPEVTPESEMSAMTSNDLYEKIRVACRSKIGAWCYVAFWFPNEKTVWVKTDSCKGELDFLLFTYEVSEDVVSVSEGTPVALAISISSVNQVIADKNDALILANTKIESLNSQVEALSPFKAAYEQAEAEKAEAERNLKVASMRKDAVDSKCFTDAELESDEFAQIFSSLNESALKLLIADRVLEKLRSTEVVETKPEIQTSAIKADLVNDEVATDYVAIMKKFLQ